MDLYTKYRYIKPVKKYKYMRSNSSNLFIPITQGYYIYKLRHRVDRYVGCYRCHSSKRTKSALFYSYDDAYNWLVRVNPATVFNF